ncbi:GNAT family N-acetyltransferase [Kocuria sp. cx-455]|uniref:GNAT family N-acetyltransferase n=1 Tax=Kocuria sp. cx-455 TaxID=2771377 RepID=UPI001688E876|nr:GNAT family protein [Kocuria sp. cx-455]MBD2766069.1 GNAT family N-acetyltransferase [Kocuria sp. cx-455]
MTSTPPLQLKPFDATDVPFFANMAADPRVTKFVGDGSIWDQATLAEKTNNALRAAPLNEQGAARWFVALHDGQPVGVLVSTRREAGVEIGYWVPPEHWGQGIAGSMVDAGLETIPALYDSDNLIARVDPDNTASARVLTRRGFHVTGCENGLDRYTRKEPSSAAP